MAKKKSAAQLNREIAEALAKAPKRKRGHHVSRGVAADDWDVAMDALIERDPKRAAEIVRKIREEHGATVNATEAFSDTVRATPQRVRDRFFKLTETEIPAKPSKGAVDFFRKHAGYSHGVGESKAKAQTRNAQSLARAEAEAKARGWTVEWEDDPEEWQGDGERPFEVLTATLYDADGGGVLDSLGGNGMTGNRKTDADFRRVVEAELAASVLPKGAFE